MNTVRGFSLIELVVGLVILGILMSIAIPVYTDWLRNMRVRTAAESFQNGMQLARAEAVRRNTRVGLYLVTTVDGTCALNTAGPSWAVSLLDPSGLCDQAAVDAGGPPNPGIIQVRNAAEGATSTTIAGAQSSFVFNSLGRLTTGAATQIDVSSSTGAACLAGGGPVRCLRIAVSVGGQVRMCDPALPAADTQAC